MIVTVKELLIIRDFRSAKKKGPNVILHRLSRNGRPCVSVTAVKFIQAGKEFATDWLAVTADHVLSEVIIPYGVSYAVECCVCGIARDTTVQDVIHLGEAPRKFKIGFLRNSVRSLICIQCVKSAMTGKLNEVSAKRHDCFTCKRKDRGGGKRTSNGRISCKECIQMFTHQNFAARWEDVVLPSKPLYGGIGVTSSDTAVSRLQRSEQELMRSLWWGQILWQGPPEGRLEPAQAGVCLKHEIDYNQNTHS